ncbi:MAG: DUF2281 domain-containing protein [Leptolyngbyaceae cyanobacterium CSU_1_4]|nr:DUF2281 domain-containing protein [Leptolyngbyaceae cyanobacterium CSU_1_4]
MNQAQFFEKIQALPADKQAEVFDFIEFLASRSPTKLLTKECLADRLLMMPDYGLDEDFARIDESEGMDDVFD